MVSVILVLLGTFFLAYVLPKALKFWRSSQAIGHWPGYRTLFLQYHPIGSLVRPTRGIAPGWNHVFLNKHKLFASIGWDAYYSIGAIPQASVFVVADAAAIKEIVTLRTRYPKKWLTELMFFGPNIVAAEGEVWKKYKKICAPAFSEPNNKLVWEETIKTVQEMFDVPWKGKDVVEVDHAVEMTLNIALAVISAAGFGQTISWKDEPIIPPGHEMTFKEALRTTVSNILWRLLIPTWLPSYLITEHVRKVRLSFKELAQYLSEMVDARQASSESTHHDLFNNLLRANEGGDSDQKLDKDEVIGNMFIFFVAGHETTAHTLSFVLALIALHQEEQDKLYEQVNSVFSKSEFPTYSQMPLLTRCMAVLYETLRLFPPVGAIPKYCAEDTTIQIGNSKGQTTTIPIPEDTYVSLNAAGLHYNPRYWEDPYKFNPDRFLGSWQRDAFLPFSAGHRGCLGRRFSEIEAVAAISLIVSRYKIEVTEEPQFAGETFAQRCDRVLACSQNLTLTPSRVPLTFRKRD